MADVIRIQDRKVRIPPHRPPAISGGAKVLLFTGIRYDCGSKLGYLRATVEYGLRHPDLGQSFRAYLDSVLER